MCVKFLEAGAGSTQRHLLYCLSALSFVFGSLCTRNLNDYPYKSQLILKNIMGSLPDRSLDFHITRYAHTHTHTLICGFSERQL